MTLIAMIRTADGTLTEVDVPGVGMDAARAVVPEGGQLLSVRRPE